MIKIFSKAVVIFLLASFIFINHTSANKNQSEVRMNGDISKITVKDIDGKLVKLSDYSGKVLLIVNVASKCGYTKQYAGLEQIYREYKDKGFEILAFPCNQFGGQEPGTNEEIKDFCSTKFDVTFKLFDKIDVNGKDQSALYKILTDNEITGKADIKWNFEKFLVGKDGKIIERYTSKVEPTSEELTSAIEKELKK